MIKEKANERFVQLEEDLDLFSEMGIGQAQKLTGKLHSIQVALDALKTEVKSESFADPNEEIHFFKYVKPKFLACKIFELEKFKFETDKPKGDETMIRVYYEQELKFIRHYFDKHKFLYQYYLLDGKELDHIYFIRGVNEPSILMGDIQGLDPDFSTQGDYLFANFLAMEQLQNYLMNCIYHPIEDDYFKITAGNSAQLRWTGESINLIELAYGIWLTGQINHGNATIKGIIALLETALQVKIGRPARRWTEISQRKMISPTKYIDQLKTEILKKINDGNK